SAKGKTRHRTDACFDRHTADNRPNHSDKGKTSHRANACPYIFPPSILCRDLSPPFSLSSEFLLLNSVLFSSEAHLLLFLQQSGTTHNPLLRHDSKTALARLDIRSSIMPI